MGCSCQDSAPVTIQYFIDTNAPIITITSPTAITYDVASVTLTYSISERGVTSIYIDNVANTSLLASGSVLTGLVDGAHNVTIVVTDGAGNTGRQVILFTINIMTTTTPKTATNPGFTFVTLSLLLTILISLIIYRRRIKFKDGK